MLLVASITLSNVWFGLSGSVRWCKPSAETKLNIPLYTYKRKWRIRWIVAFWMHQKTIATIIALLLDCTGRKHDRHSPSAAAPSLVWNVSPHNLCLISTENRVISSLITKIHSNIQRYHLACQNPNSMITPKIKTFSLQSPELYFLTYAKFQISFLVCWRMHGPSHFRRAALWSWYVVSPARESFYWSYGCPIKIIRAQGI